MSERDARHKSLRASVRLLTELHGMRAALESARKRSNNPALVFRLAGEVAALERRLEMVRQGKGTD